MTEFHIKAHTRLLPDGSEVEVPGRTTEVGPGFKVTEVSDEALAEASPEYAEALARRPRMPLHPDAQMILPSLRTLLLEHGWTDEELDRPEGAYTALEQAASAVIARLRP